MNYLLGESTSRIKIYLLNVVAESMLTRSDMANAAVVVAVPGWLISPTEAKTVSSIWDAESAAVLVMSTLGSELP